MIYAADAKLNLAGIQHISTFVLFPMRQSTPKLSRSITRILLAIKIASLAATARKLATVCGFSQACAGASLPDLVQTDVRPTP